MCPDLRSAGPFDQIPRIRSYSFTEQAQCHHEYSASDGRKTGEKCRFHLQIRFRKASLFCQPLLSFRQSGWKKTFLPLHSAMSAAVLQLKQQGNELPRLALVI